MRCRVVNARGEDCPDWVPGELWLGGRGVANGYRRDPERTADRFVDWEGTRWYRTGDLGRYWPDGTVEFLGRRDHQVKIRGYRVELGEVEAALRAVPGVHRAVADVVGDDTRKLVAAVTLDGETGPEAVRAAVSGALPPYMVPERVEVFDEFPLTGNGGKLDRKAVRERLAAGSGQRRSHVAPGNDLEAAIADLVGKVLGLDQVSVEDDFIGLGGDSVLATAVIARIRDWLDTTEAAVGDLFAGRTVRGLAARLAGKQSRPGRLEEAATIYLEVSAA
jgi:mycobactin phenyloxazoline synthetase